MTLELETLGFTPDRLNELIKNIYVRLRANLPQFAVIQLNETARSKSDGGPMPVKTGNLIDSIRITTLNEEQLIIGVGTNVKYAIYVEWGTRHMAAQMPFEKGASAALEKILALVDQILDEEIDKAFDKAFEGLDI